MCIRRKRIPDLRLAWINSPGADLDHITLNFDTVRHIVQAEALKHGFSLVAEQFIPEVFGSRLVLYQRDNEAIRFLFGNHETAGFRAAEGQGSLARWDKAD